MLWQRSVTQHGGGAVEGAEPAAEARGGEEAAPLLADEGGADEEGRFAGREADEDLFDEILHQRWRRRRHARFACFRSIASLP